MAMARAAEGITRTRRTTQGVISRGMLVGLILLGYALGIGVSEVCGAYRLTFQHGTSVEVQGYQDLGEAMRYPRYRADGHGAEGPGNGHRGGGAQTGTGDSADARSARGAEPPPCCSTDWSRAESRDLRTSVSSLSADRFFRIMWGDRGGRAARQTLRGRPRGSRESESEEGDGMSREHIVTA